jgi:hypothetical protein
MGWFYGCSGGCVDEKEESWLPAVKRKELNRWKSIEKGKQFIFQSIKISGHREEES